MRRGSVLLADSHSPMLVGIRSLLNERFDAVVMVADERSLLEAMERFRPDLVIVDVSLPHTAGKNVIEVVHERFPGTALIALSLFNDPSVTSRILASGAIAVVMKSASATELAPALEAVSSRRKYTTLNVSTPSISNAHS